MLYCDKAKKKRSGKIGKNEKQGLFYDFWLKKALSRTVETAGKRRNCVEKICKTVVTITISIQTGLTKNVGYNQTKKLGGEMQYVRHSCRIEGKGPAVRQALLCTVR